MQPIERYGVISLLALVVIITAVILWDQAEDEQPVHAAGPSTTQVEPRGLNRDALVAGGPSARTNVPIKTSKWGTVDLEEERRQQERERQAGKDMLDEVIEELAKNKPAAQDPAPALEADRRTGWGTGPVEPSMNQPSSPEGPSKLASTVVEERPQPRAKLSSAPRSYTVAAGDTMGAIAQDQLGGVTHTKALMAANPGVDPARMSVGTKLVLPDVGTGPVASQDRTQAQPAATPASDDLGSYVVQEGDSLWKIADRTLGDGSRFKDIERVNPQLDADRLRPGQRIKLPSGATALRASASNAIASNAAPSKQTTTTPKKGIVR